MDFVSEVIERRPQDQTTGLRAFNRHAQFIAGYQVRSAGSVAGNIFMTRDHANRGEPLPVGRVHRAGGAGHHDYDRVR